MTYAEALKRAENWMEHLDSEWSTRPDENDKEALAVLTALAEENERIGKCYAELVDTNMSLYIDNDNLKVDLELENMLTKDLTRDMNEYHDKAEKAGAALSSLGSEAERVRPIIDAIMGAEEFGVNPHGLYHIWAFRHGQALLKACYEYWKEKGGHDVD